MVVEAPLPNGAPALRWSARAHSIAEIETELARMWASQDLTTDVEGEPGRHVAARTSVMNLVVVARRPELAERCAATIQALTGRHPSRTIVIQSADPDGPSWLDARVEAHCVLPREDAPETCAETIHVTCGGEAGHHLAAISTPLIIHDLPVTVWWPGEPPLRSRPARDLLATADRLIVDGSTWSGDGLARLRELADLQESSSLAISDFALVRQSRWREAIASTFDDPDFLPYLRSLRRIAVTYATHDETGMSNLANVVKPIYHVGWIASRLGLSVITPLALAPTRRRAPGQGLRATLSDGRAHVAVAARPVVSVMPAGTTLRVELLAVRRGSELRVDVTAEAETVRVRVWQDGKEAWDRRFRAPRRTDVDLLAEAIEAGQRDPVAVGALRSAAALALVLDAASAGDRPGAPSVSRVSKPEIVVVADPPAAAVAAAGRIATILAQAVAERGRADWATTGGSAPIGIYRQLVAAPLRDAVPWAAVQVWWGDDRYVPRDHPLSNVKPLDDILLEIGAAEEGRAVGSSGAGIPLQIENLHPFRTSEAIAVSRGPAWCAATLADELRAAALPVAVGWPVFDLILLGIGPDGHLLSVFPGSPAFDSRELALAIPAPDNVDPRVERVTLNPAVIGVARHVLVVVTGAAKAAVLADIFGEEHDPRRWPGQLARRGGAAWIVDAAAAERLPR